MNPSFVFIHRHGILLFFMIIKYIFFLFLISIVAWMSIAYRYIFPADLSNYIILPVLILSINYFFFCIILEGINFYGRIMIVGELSIVIAHTSFILIDDIEFIDTKSILKLDVERHGLISNILNYWDLIIEQPNDVRRIPYIPFPYVIYDTIKQHIPTVVTSTKKK